MIPTSLALILMGLFADFWLIPRLVRTLPTYTDWPILRRVYWVLFAMSALLALHAVGLVLTWVADDYPRVTWEGALLLGMVIYLAWSVRPPAALRRRIEGLRAMEHAVEDRPDWAKGGK